jgi:hypothetical protein
MSDVIATEAATEPVNIAAMMARDGIKTDDSPVNSIPVNNTPPVTEAPPADTPKSQESVATETVTTTPTIEAPPVEPPRAAPPTAPEPRPAQTPAPDWRELIKQQPEAEVFKHFGLDEKMINFLSRWKGGEDLKDYMEAITVDYTKMSPEEVLRRHLIKDFGGLSAEDFEEVYKMKVIEQYKLDPDIYDEKDVRRGRLLLGVDADRVRQDFIKRQQDLLLSKPPQPDTSAAELAAIAEQEQRAKEVQDYHNHVQSNSYTKDLLATNLLKIGEGDKAFNLEVGRPDDVLGLLYDPAKWAQKLFNEDGTPNVRKQLVLAAIANDDTAFFTNLTKHYEMLGAKSVADKIANASEPGIGTASTGNADAANPIAQLARFGMITSGD